MITIDVTIKDEITKDLIRMKKELAALPKQALIKYKELTPIDRGNARNSTFLLNKDTIRAGYPYAERLDNGWSKQAPKGMTIPLEKWLEMKAKTILG